jgi:hypothetical protein
LLFDSDRQGKESSAKLAGEHNLKEIRIPEKLASKDYSDLVKNKGVALAAGTLFGLLNK